MDYGLYTAFLGMRARQRTLDAQANNIANATTTGYKADRLVYSAIEAAKKGAGSPQNLVAGVETSGASDFTAGSIHETGRSLDVAIDGDAFLQVQTERGTRYTRAGNLTLNSDGQLVTHNGDLVVGEGGAITIPQKGTLSIGQDGTISADGKTVDKLKLVRFDNPVTALTKEGDAMFSANGKAQPIDDTNSKVQQGALEASNVNPISEMVAMINNNREFDSLQKSVSLLMNDLGKKISSEIGKL